MSLSVFDNFIKIMILVRYLFHCCILLFLFIQFFLAFINFSERALNKISSLFASVFAYSFWFLLKCLGLNDKFKIKFNYFFIFLHFLFCSAIYLSLSLSLPLILFLLNYFLIEIIVARFIAKLVFFLNSFNASASFFSSFSFHFNFIYMHLYIYMYILFCFVL